MKKSLLMMVSVLALFSFIIIGPISGNNGKITTMEHGANW